MSSDNIIKMPIFVFGLNKMREAGSEEGTWAITRDLFGGEIARKSFPDEVKKLFTAAEGGKQIRPRCQP